MQQDCDRAARVVTIACVTYVVVDAGEFDEGGSEAECDGAEKKQHFRIADDAKLTRVVSSTTRRARRETPIYHRYSTGNERTHYMHQRYGEPDPEPPESEPRFATASLRSASCSGGNVAT